MATQEQIMGNWGQLKGKIKQRWGQLTDDELREVEGNYDQLVGLVQQKTGEARHQIESTLNELSEQGAGAFNQAADTARQYVDEYGERMRHATEEFRGRAMEGYGQAQEMIRQHPAESLAVAFGTGLFLGVVVGLIAGSRD
jgi:uncharacterized protein YjbJ (UPF0337 family)